MVVMVDRLTVIEFSQKLNAYNQVPASKSQMILQKSFSILMDQMSTKTNIPKCYRQILKEDDYDVNDNSKLLAIFHNTQGIDLFPFSSCNT